MRITGGCSCSKIRYRAVGPPKFQGNCHCENCRRAAGAQSVAWISIEKKSFAIVRGKPKRYRTKTKAWRTFCPACGTSLTYESPKRLRDIDITTASLDHPGKFPPNRDFFVEEKLPWVSRVRRRRA
ncbi:MAG TPA: GFA family protein [Verrucomicrobiae bacterium]|nr:GFA family protein [Verrucomicrobiae bacterium]